MNRRVFLKSIAGSIIISSISHRLLAKTLPKLTKINNSVVSEAVGGTYYERTRAAVDALGGISKFIKPGDAVVIKPNAAFAQTPQMGGNTRPEVVEAVIKLCHEAKAGSVAVVERCLSAHGLFGTLEDRSGITQVAARKGALVFDAGKNPSNYTELRLDAPGIPMHGFITKFWEADIVINLPRAKTHPLMGYTLCVKNLMGTLQDPRSFHSWGKSNWSEKILRRYHRLMGIKEERKPHNALPINLVALARRMKKRVNLNIVDMSELVRGWDATRPGILEPKNTIIAGTDMVSVDAYCVRIFGEDPLLGRWKLAHVDNYIRMMHEKGIGNGDVQTLSVIKTEA